MAAYSGYRNPLAGAKVTPERIDQGVDYAGTGTLAAIGAGVITKVVNGPSSGWPGNYLEYQITDGPLKGQNVYYAEGVTPTVTVGQRVNAGDVIANLIPGWHSGVELGFASGVGTSSYAAQHGGYTEGDLTAAGQQFSDLIAQLGGPAGLAEGRTPKGAGPTGSGGSSILNSINNVATGIPVIGSAVSGVETGVKVGEAFAGFLNNPVPVLLTIGLVLLGAVMIFSGAGRMLGFDSPIKSAVGKVPKVVPVPV